MNDTPTLTTLDGDQPITLCFSFFVQGRQGIQGKNRTFENGLAVGLRPFKKVFGKIPWIPWIPCNILILPEKTVQGSSAVQGSRLAEWHGQLLGIVHPIIPGDIQPGHVGEGAPCCGEVAHAVSGCSILPNHFGLAAGAAM